MKNCTRYRGILPCHFLATPVLSILFFFILNFKTSAQSGCPGCKVDLPLSLPADTIFLQKIPAGDQFADYDQDISFRLPKTTTPVNSIDSVTPPGLPITKFEITDIENMPAGLSWQLSKSTFNTATETDGCIKICGQPTVADTFILNVKVKATVFILTQESSFPMTFVIHPKTIETDGFSMSNVKGCGSVEVSFTNNLPSGGQPGYGYVWDFGDSTSFAGENPPPHLYETPGMYVVNYHATLDTVGYVLKSIRVLGVDCTDQLGIGAPDLYAVVEDPNGAQVFYSSPEIVNATLPLTMPIGVKLSTGNYTLKVVDEDSGLEGTDDLCGSISFNYLSNDTLVSGGFRVVLDIERPLVEVFSADTVTVFPTPIKPVVSAPMGAEACAGESSVVLGSNYGAGNQWFMNGTQIPGANEFTLKPKESGFYQVRVKNSFGCISISDSVKVTFHPLPAVPLFINNNNRLEVADLSQLPANYSLQWFNFDAPIPGETDIRYCATETGKYGLEVTDNATGCSNYFDANIVFNPNFDCTVGSNEAVFGQLKIFPNPVSGLATVQAPTVFSSGSSLKIWDLTGRMLQKMEVPAGQSVISVDCSTLDAGIYLIEILENEKRLTAKLSVVRGN